VSAIVARLLPGRVADRRGRFAAIVPGMIVTAVGMYVVSSAASAEAFILAGVAVGIGFATAQPALQALAIDLAGPAERGTAMATFWAFTDFGVITGSFVSGHVVLGPGRRCHSGSREDLCGVGGAEGDRTPDLISAIQDG